jgi:hypothetical protein
MSQIYPSPTLYTYRVRAWGAVPGINLNTVTVDGIAQGNYGVNPVNFIPEYSADSGTTWKPASNSIFHSLQEAYQDIANIVNNESSFQTYWVSNAALLPGYTSYTYPV